ncbi:MaoC/PaaZ C-terminal domain-containing protein [Prescottella sp. R16]|uniref:MaoC/PaaZ C-terminal domain-containing protein n=1 Tax=Prescottella sp. R16 TaxID=3064529 RepID=UPI00272EBA5E|nr:MaoC/PaaZ C-terminal domain-containing protein [Prescottella sp. R16]
MPIDVAAALSAAPTVQTVQWTERDVLLYHLSIGAGSDPLDAAAQRWIYERDLQVFPTFAVVAGKGVSTARTPRTATLPGIDVPPSQLLHAGQQLIVHRSLDRRGPAVVTSRLTDIRDQGRAAIIEMEAAACDPAGEPYWTSTMSVWAAGAGGYGGAPPQSAPTALPDREPDRMIRRTTRDDQALLYRLNGGMNPMHVDPAVARQAGFERPTLHGLATYGVTCKALADTMLDGDPSSIGSLSVRFADHMLPGHSLDIAVWVEGQGPGKVA